MSRLTRRPTKCFPTGNSEISLVHVAETGEVSYCLGEIGKRGKNDVQVDDGLGRETRNGGIR